MNKFFRYSGSKDRYTPNINANIKSNKKYIVNRLLVVEQFFLI